MCHIDRPSTSCCLLYPLLGIGAARTRVYISLSLASLCDSSLARFGRPIHIVISSASV